MIRLWDETVGLPTRLDPRTPESERARWKVVRLDSGDDVPGLILLATVETGKCSMRRPDGYVDELAFGPHSIRIVRR
jgi:hypothetical protein